jgi:hypothetical protein
MRSNLFTLEVHGVDTKSLHVHSRITETGSDLPRATLAYYFSILEMMQNFTDTTICPLVIDSPNQQDQDPKNLPTILKFIRDKRPTDTQLVLGLVDDCNVDFGGKIEVLKSKRRLLLDDDYNEHAMEVRDLIRKSL